MKGKEKVHVQVKGTVPFATSTRNGRHEPAIAVIGLVFLCVLLSILTAAIVFFALLGVDFLIMGHAMQISDRDPSSAFMMVAFPVTLLIHLSIFFLGGFVLCAHRWNVLGKTGRWSQHMYRNHLGLGVALGAFVQIVLLSSMFGLWWLLLVVVRFVSFVVHTP
jgi:hypothetical protein